MTMFVGMELIRMILGIKFIFYMWLGIYKFISFGAFI